ncbi:hypothetical protein BKA83DRAFT_4532065 [Pisolithus microcarpus]|nr:hypothetical protein BKA83DRAFT_4532065 [Pisolithus microcarpus]
MLMLDCHVLPTNRWHQTPLLESSFDLFHHHLRVSHSQPCTPAGVRDNMESNNRRIPNHSQSTNRLSQYKDPLRQDQHRSTVRTSSNPGKRPAPSPPDSPPPHRTSKQYLAHYSLHRPVIQQHQDNRVAWADYDDDMDNNLEGYEDTHHHPQHPTMDPGLTHQEAMEELGLALDKALFALKAISVHATFPADFIDKATSIYEKVSGLCHKQPQPALNSNQDIVSILMKLTQEVEDLKCSHTNQPNSHPLKDSFTTRPIIKPQPGCLLIPYHHHPPMGKFPHNNIDVLQPLPALSDSLKLEDTSTISYFASHPPTWTWAVKAGPNKGKTFQVPTIPIVCDDGAPRAVHWMVGVFHLFKAHLNPIAIDATTGRVLPDWLRLYQNNLYIHLHSQVKARSPHPKPAPPTTTPTPSGTQTVGTHPKPKGLITTKVDRLQTELHALKEKFYKYIVSHEACCHRSDSTSKASEEEALSDGNDPPPSTSTTPPFTLLIPNSNPPQWLTTVLNHLDLPPEFSGLLYSPDLNSLDESNPPPLGCEHSQAALLWQFPILSSSVWQQVPTHLLLC